MARRYLTVVAIILAAFTGLGVQLKPPLEVIRAGVEEGLTAYAADNLQAGEAMPQGLAFGPRGPEEPFVCQRVQGHDLPATRLKASPE